MQRVDTEGIGIRVDSPWTNQEFAEECGTHFPDRRGLQQGGTGDFMGLEGVTRRVLSARWDHGRRAGVGLTAGSGLVRCRDYGAGFSEASPPLVAHRPMPDPYRSAQCRNRIVCRPGSTGCEDAERLMLRGAPRPL